MSNKDLRIIKITHLINENPDAQEGGMFEECPECGDEFAMIGEHGEIWCANRECKHYNKEYVSMLWSSMTAADVEKSRIYKTKGFKHPAYGHRYIGSGGSVTMKSIREKAMVSDVWNDEMLHRLNEGEDVDSAGRTIKFDDFIDKGHYYVLFIKLQILERSIVRRSYKYADKYMKLQWRWPSPDCVKFNQMTREDVPIKAGEHGAWGDAIRTATHKYVVCTKAYISKMYVDGKRVDPMKYKF